MATWFAYAEKTQIRLLISRRNVFLISLSSTSAYRKKRSNIDGLFDGWSVESFHFDLASNIIFILIMILRHLENLHLMNLKGTWACLETFYMSFFFYKKLYLKIHYKSKEKFLQ